MAKRFIDSALWEKAWFRKLTPSHKCAWVYILSRCDAVGVWDADFEAAEFYIGEPVDWDAFAKACNGNIEALSNGKWWITDYCKYQYGELTSSCPPHRNYIKMLENHGLFERVTKGYSKGSNTLQEEEEEEEEEKEILSGGIGGTEVVRKARPTLAPILFDFEAKAWDGISDEQVADWSAVYPALKIDLELGKAREWILANPTKTKKNWRRFLVNWFGRAQERGGDKPWKK